MRVRLQIETLYLAGIFKHFWLKTPARYRVLLLILLATTIVPRLAYAAADAPPPMETGEDVVVTATRVPTGQLATPGAVDVIRLDNIRASLPLIDAAEVLNRAPGLNIQNRQNYAQDTQISIRGFGSRSTFGIRGIKLYVDDIPAGIPDGQAQGAIIPFFAVNSIEVLRGPWAVGYGNAAGGVISATTKRAKTGPSLELRALTGGDATTVITIRAGMPTQQDDAISGFVAAQRLRSDGYRDHSRVQRDHTYARIDLALAASTALVLTGNRIEQPETQDPLGLTRAQFDVAPRQVAAAATQFNTRKSISHQQAGAVLTSQLAGLEWKVILYSGTRDVVQFLSTPVAAQVAATSAGGVVDFQRRFQGAGLRATNDQGPLTWTLGADFDRAEDDRRGFENFVQRAGVFELGVRGNLRRDEVNRQRANDLFGTLNWTADDAHSLHIGVRRSDIRLTVADRFVRAGNGDDSGGIRYTGVSPSLGLVRRINAVTSFYLSASHGFETPTAAELAYKPDQSTGLNFALQPSTTRQWEAGVKHIMKELSVKLALFDIRSENEIVQAASIGGRASFQNAAATSRRGAELSIDWKPSRQLSAYAALTGIRAAVGERYVAGFGSAARIVAAGSAMPAVPRANLFAEVVWHPAGRGAAGASIAADVTARARIAADDANRVFAAGFAAIGASLRYRMQSSLRWMQTGYPVELEFAIRGDNLTNAKYAGSVIVNEANLRYFESAAARRGSVNVGAVLRF